MMNLQMMFGPTFLRGQVSMLAEEEDLLHLALNWAGVNSLLGHMRPPGLRLPTSGLLAVKKRSYLASSNSH